MSENAHSQGEWERRPFNALRDELGPPGKAVCTVWVRKEVGVYSDQKMIVPDDEGEANARLLLAAPDMLAALEKVLEYEMSDWKSQQEFGGYVLDDDVREAVQQAIRLAKEGR